MLKLSDVTARLLMVVVPLLLTALVVGCFLLLLLLRNAQPGGLPVQLVARMTWRERAVSQRLVVTVVAATLMWGAAPLGGLSMMMMKTMSQTLTYPTLTSMMTMTLRTILKKRKKRSTPTMLATTATPHRHHHHDPQHPHERE